MLADLRGIAAVSAEDLALVEEAVKTKLILDSVDAWLLSQPTLINKQTGTVLLVVRDRHAADAGRVPEHQDNGDLHLLVSFKKGVGDEDDRVARRDDLCGDGVG